MQDAVETCYALVSTVHSIWKPIPMEFDDYISNPKPSGYQALHTAVKGPGGIPMELQIKTSSMHDLAEYGFYQSSHTCLFSQYRINTCNIMTHLF